MICNIVITKQLQNTINLHLNNIPLEPLQSLNYTYKNSNNKQCICTHTLKLKSFFSYLKFLHGFYMATYDLMYHFDFIFYRA